MQAKHSGIHYPNGPFKEGDEERLMKLPSELLLMLATEGRFHYSKAREAGKTVVWRALPRRGSRPAELGWSKYEKNATEALNLWDEQPHGGEEYFVPYNELDLNFERGDNDNDFDGLADRYHLLTSFLVGMYGALRQKLPNDVKILFPPFTPDHGDKEYVDMWRNAANMYDGIVIHAYEDPQQMLERFNWYAEQFPDKKILIGEWNSHQPEEFLAALKTLEGHPQFMGATYFIWHWYDSPGYWPAEYNMDEREELYNLFLNASEPSVVEDSPTPVEEPPAPQPEPVVEEPQQEFNWPDEPQEWTQDAIIAESNRQADNLGIPHRVLLGLLVAESGLQAHSSRFAYRNEDGSYTNLSAAAREAIQQRNIGTFSAILAEIESHHSHDVSFGLGQQTVRWASEGDHTQSPENVLAIRSLYFDPVHAIASAGKQVATYWRTYQNDIEALSRYNKPSLTPEQNPVAVANYKRGLAKADELLAGQKEEPMSTTTNFIQAPTGNTAGLFSSQPRGFILHGSRSGVAGRDKATEAKGCSNWCVNNPDGLGWHASIGENEVYVHMKASQWGWNARRASDKYIGVEFAQSVVSDPVTDAQVDAFVAYVKEYVLPIYPAIPRNFVTHADVEASGETGKRDGKTDAFPSGSPQAADLKKRIQAKLNAPKEKPQTMYEFRFGFKAKADELGAEVVGEPLEDEQYLGGMFSYQTTTKGVMFYSKSANKVTFVAGE